MSKQQQQQPPAATPPPGVWSEAKKSTSKSKAFKVSNKAMPSSRRWSDIDDELDIVKDDEIVSVASLETESPESASSEVDSDSVAGSD